MTMKRKLLLIVINLCSADNQNFYKTLIESRKGPHRWVREEILPRRTVIKSTIITNCRLFPPEPRQSDKNINKKDLLIFFYIFFFFYFLPYCPRCKDGSFSTLPTIESINFINFINWMTRAVILQIIIYYFL